MKTINLLSILVVLICSCQKSDQDLLSEVSNDLNKMSSVKYVAEHQQVSDGKIVFEKSDTVNLDFHNDNPHQLKYYLHSEESKLIFNGKDIYQSLAAEKIITTGKSNDPEYFNNPLIFSLSYLRQILPKLIDNERVNITTRDTIVNKVDLVCFDFLLDSAYIHPTTYQFVSNNESSKFSVLVDKNDKLPYKIIVPHDQDGQSTQTYHNIELNPAFDKQIWTGDNLPTDYVRITEKEYYDNRKNKMESHIGEFMTDWKLPQITTNSPVELSNLKENVILLDFWFKGCAPCISSIPSLNEIVSKYAHKNFKLFGVEYQTKDRDALQKYLKKNQVQYPSLFLGKEMALNYGITSGPTFMIVDKQGKIIHIKSGYSDQHMKEIDEIIKKSL